MCLNNKVFWEFCLKLDTGVVVVHSDFEFVTAGGDINFVKDGSISCTRVNDVLCETAVIKMRRAWAVEAT